MARATTEPVPLETCHPGWSTLTGVSAKDESSSSRWSLNLEGVFGDRVEAL
eukprot:CAMPEP_0171305560 /NCGR_PEP_ID=MMETSP0816-20121228/15449_1 /TAXON_ID=420281 /ORGANISM="Proboscia inermis, Strain CCAP1064/1" /LENGTH=50 /DNA_ID=CAMNT_0011786503 /DNA_START=170 /DNA_END=322 /DNA_ORIENTATION=+